MGDEAVDVVDKATPKPQSNPQGSSAPGESPPPPLEAVRFAVSSYRVRVGQAATFTKLTGYTYALKTPTRGVTLSDVEGDATKKQVGSTEAVSGVIVVGTKDGNAIECEPIEFFLFHVANKKALQDEIKKAIAEHGATANLNYIDTSDITDMSNLFQNNATFNGDISKWDVSSVTNMQAMFSGAIAFNQPLNSWKVLSVTDMSYMFAGARAFNQPLNKWNIAEVIDIKYIFYNAIAFNQNISGWADYENKYERNRTGMFDGADAMQEDYKPRWAL